VEKPTKVIGAARALARKRCRRNHQQSGGGGGAGPGAGGGGKAGAEAAAAAAAAAAAQGGEAGPEARGEKRLLGTARAREFEVQMRMVRGGEKKQREAGGEAVEGGSGRRGRRSRTGFTTRGWHGSACSKSR